MTTAQSPRFIELGDVEEYVGTHKSAWIQCRSSKHNMLDYDARMGQGDTYVVIQRCSRCYTKRHEVLDDQGIILSAHYEYPEGYLFPKGSGRMSTEANGVFRLARVNNFLARKRERTR
jgi:hypothetical protein